MARRFHTLDVFTDTALAGNPLAVVSDADGLTDERMQAIAREFNLSETVFLLPAENGLHSARARIFTPLREVPFAGHPTIGAAVLIAARDWPEEPGGERDGIVVLEEGIGPVRVGVALRPGEAPFAEFDLPQMPTPMQRLLAPDRLAGAIGVMETDIGFDNHKPTVFTAGLEYTFVPVRNLETLRTCRCNEALGMALFGAENGGAAYVYTRLDGKDGADYQARMFDPAAGIAEDPATGSAVAALAGVIARFDGLADGQHRLRIAQGREMGRPGLIRLEIELAAGRLQAARIGGHAVPVSEGEIDV